MSPPLFGVAIALSVFSQSEGLTPSTLEKSLDQAIRTYAFGQFAEAATRLAEVAEEAVRLRSPPALVVRAKLFLAASHFALGNHPKATQAIEDALRIDPTARADPRRLPPHFVKVVDDVRGKLTGVVVVACDRPDGAVEIVGERHARCGDTVAVRIGRHVVRAVLAGKTFEQPVLVPVSGRVTVRFVFEEPVRLPPIDNMNRAADRLQEAPSAMRRRRALGWGLLLGGAAPSLVAGAVFQFLAKKTADDLDARRAQGVATVSDGNAAVDTIGRQETASAVLFSLAGAFAVSGTVLVILSREKKQPAA